MNIWAKSNSLSLKEHTRHLLDAIDEIYKKRNFKKFRISSFNIDDLKELLKFAAFFHDLGKVSPNFQRRIGNINYQIKGFPHDFPDIRHNIFSLFFIDKRKLKKILNKYKKDESLYTLYTIFLSAIAFHHWKIDEEKYLLNINNDLMNASKILLNNNNGKNLADALKNHFQGFKFDGVNCIDYIDFDVDMAENLKRGAQLISMNIIPPYDIYFLPERLRVSIDSNLDLNLWIFLSGFLMRLDHFVSMEEQKGNSNFTFNDIEKDIPNTNLGNNFKMKFKNFWQKEAKRFNNTNLILIAPTGIGKTEFAFLWAEGEKFFYTLPLRVATNQIFERACNYFNGRKGNIQNLFIEDNVGLLHSDADIYIYEKWENSKEDIDGETPKILDLAENFSLPVNICTGDQIFPASLKYPQYEKIYATLGYSKLIIDEVQAYDPTACAIILKMIEDIVSLGGKFILITATFPSFVEEYLKERNLIKDEEIINCYKDNNPISLVLKDISKHKIELRGKDIEDDDNIEEIIKIAKGGNRVLIVLNTIEKAESVYSKVKNRVSDGINFLDLIHSRFTFNERKQKEKKLEVEFKNPKLKNEREPKILIATQVIEVSLDIDADYLFTEIAPMDSLIQRMGRVMRRVDLLTGKIKNSNDDFKYENYYTNNEPNIYIYYQKQNKKNGILESGGGKVYSNDLLKNTIDVLSNYLGKTKEIPEKMKYDLVNKVYKNLKNTKYLKDFYQTFAILDAGYISKNKRDAQNLFRNISTISLIEENKIKGIVNKINQQLKNPSNITWLWFKKEIIAEYVINDNIWRYKVNQLETLWNFIKRYIMFCNNRIQKRIERYCEGIYVLEKGDKSEVGSIL